jgi:hypothetical protein
MLCQIRDWPTSGQHKRHYFQRKVCFRIPARRNLSIYCWHWSCLTSYLHVTISLHGVVPKHWSSFVCTVPVRTSASATWFKAQWLLYVPPRWKHSGCTTSFKAHWLLYVPPSWKRSGCCMYHFFKAQWLLYVPPPWKRSGFCMYHRLESAVVAACTTPLKHSGCSVYHFF